MAKAKPISELEGILNWSEDSSETAIVASISYTGAVKQPNRPRTLLCHDMAGGYLADCNVQGVGTSEAYRFFHWHRIDTFVYFSHHLLTIPPPCWTNAAHKHNVLMMGTFITEWDQGKKSCDEFLQSEPTYKLLADKMVQIAQFYKLDGWLVNIENPIEPVEHVEALQKFVQYLTERMHAAILHSQVLWYDSVTHEGKLAWQNQLNAENNMFFDVCDGIFLNYVWTEATLQASAEFAGDRRYDVYVGADVFGRNCPGGGGFNTVEAVEAARKFDLSAAIFAPGWVYEKLPKEEFCANEIMFWDYLQQVCPVREESRALPLATSFCHGNGHGYWRHGKFVSRHSWSNLSAQSIQPVTTVPPCLTDAFYGATSLPLHFTKQQTEIKLFGRHTLSTTQLYVRYSFRSAQNNELEGVAAAAAAPAAPAGSLHPWLLLHTGSRDEEGNVLCLGGCDDENNIEGIAGTVIVPSGPEELRRVFKSSAGKLPQAREYNQAGWITRQYVLTIGGGVKEISSITVKLPQYKYGETEEKIKHQTVLLGNLQICPVDVMVEALLATIDLDSSPPPSDSQSESSSNTLTWQSSAPCHFYSVYKRTAINVQSKGKGKDNNNKEKQLAERESEREREGKDREREGMDRERKGNDGEKKEEVVAEGANGGEREQKDIEREGMDNASEEKEAAKGGMEGEREGIDIEREGMDDDDDWELVGHTHCTSFILSEKQRNAGGVYQVEGWHPSGVLVQSNSINIEKIDR